MIYSPSKKTGRICLATISELLLLSPVTEANLHMALAHFKVCGIIPETNQEFIKVVQLLQESCKDVFNFNPVLTFLNEKDIFNG